MKNKAYFLIITAAIMLFCTLNVFADDIAPFTGWKQAETNHFRFIFEDETRTEAEGFAQFADAAWNQISKIYSTPPDKIDVIVSGRTDTVNAYANMIGSYISVFTTPPLTPEFGYRENWQKLFFTHELTHIANFDFEGKQHVFGRIFGSAFNLIDMLDIPGWELEGLTTVLETELTTGGRGRSPFFELYYKAPTLDNSFLKFENIGDEKEPPTGQIYVMGYLLMRSIADRYGISALADIERNRTPSRNFTESVKLVTGHTPDELFQDVRIALEKKYADERKIPEGIIISPREKNTYYFRPALVNKDGIVTLRMANTKTAAVRYDPVEKKETVLFEGSFSDTTALTASENGTIIAALQRERYDRMPGYIVSTDLYTWTEKSGLQRLTQGNSLFQPALSRSGNRLVAVELAGGRYRIVEVDVKTGERKILLESRTESFIQPALSADGSQIAFLTLDGHRAVLTTAPMPKYEFAYPIPQTSISRVVNNTGTICDIAYPSWTKDDDLLFASNERGRLEVWAYRDGTRVPVVSDPVGAFWADKTEGGICYASYAGTGNVIKMKPTAEWGNVPDFSGPSTPGEIITLGNLATDYPDFTPWSKTETSDADEKDADIVVPRKTEGKVTAEQRDLQDETFFLNTPQLELWFPLVSVLNPPHEDLVYGGGGVAVFEGYPLQAGARMNIVGIGGNLYPFIGQANACVFGMTSFFTGLSIIDLERNLVFDSDSDDFIESSTGTLSLSIPFLSRYFYRDQLDVAAIAGFSAIAERQDASVFSANADIPYRTSVNGSAGVDAAYTKRRDSEFTLTVRGNSSVIISDFPSINTEEYDHPYVSGELEMSAAAGNDKVRGEFGLRSRWYNLPEEAPIPSTLVTLKGKYLDCTYPGRAICETAVVIPSILNYRIFMEKLISFGTNTAGIDTPKNSTPLNTIIDDDWYFGFEGNLPFGRAIFAFGLVSTFNTEEKYDPLENLTFYETIKLDGIRRTDH